MKNSGNSSSGKRGIISARPVGSTIMCPW
jgi:hypothetical protein